MLRLSLHRKAGGMTQVLVRSGALVRCAVCDEEFYAPPSRLNRAAKLYCSAPCRSLGKRRRETLVCQMCGDQFEAPVCQHRKFCSRACGSWARSTNTDGQRHNGKLVRVSASGYRLIYEPTHPCCYRDGWVLEHRWVIEQDLGRFLTADEHVHHRDGNRLNNDLANLEVLSPSEHATLTNAEIRQQIAELAEYRKRYGPLKE